MTLRNPDKRTFFVWLHKDARHRKELFIVFVVVYFLFFDTHFQLPILAPFARSLGATPFLVGLAIGIYSFFNILGNMIGGHVVDAGSWKKPLTIGIILIILSLFAYTFASSPPILLLIRAFHGFAGGLAAPATLIYLTKNPLENKADNISRRMSFYGIAIGLAALTGPPLAGILASHYGYGQTYTTIAAVMLLPALLIILFLKENKLAVTRKFSLPDYYRRIMSSNTLRLALVIVFAMMGATGTLAAFLPLKAAALGATAAVTGALFAVFAATAIAAQLFWPRLVSGFKLLHLALTGFSMLQFALILTHLFGAVPALFFALALYGFGFGLLLPALLELTSKGSQPEWRGLATGIFFTFFSLGAALVPPLGGLLQQSAAAVSPFITAVAVSLVLLCTMLQRLGEELKK